MRSLTHERCARCLSSATDAQCLLLTKCRLLPPRAQQTAHPFPARNPQLRMITWLQACNIHTERAHSSLVGPVLTDITAT
eukprot:m.928805 g.928805  ORF g.928805 m.928805 type:complete len:80 (-) comp161991_c0_seq1:53-292(-)